MERLRFEDNYAEYMEMANRWATNRNYQAAGKYTQADIDEWREGLAKDPNGMDNPYGVPNYLAYPSTQWWMNCSCLLLHRSIMYRWLVVVRIQIIFFHSAIWIIPEH